MVNCQEQKYFDLGKNGEITVAPDDAAGERTIWTFVFISDYQSQIVSEKKCYGNDKWGPLLTVLVYVGIIHFSKKEPDPLSEKIWKKKIH